MKYFFVILCLLFVGPGVVWAQSERIDLSVLNKDVVSNASVVIIDRDREYVYRSSSMAIERNKVTLAILNADGRHYADFVEHGNMNRSLRSFSGTVFNSSGAVVERVRMSDLYVSNYFEGLASDTKIYSYKPAPLSYPYFITYQSESVQTGAILNFSSFRPVPGYEASVIVSKYNLVVPPGFKFYYHQLNGASEPQKTIDKGGAERYSWVVSNFAAQKYHPYSVPAYDMFPIVFVTPAQFVWGRTSGSADSWATYAKWQWGLLAGRDVLPSELRAKVHELTDALPDARSKVQRLYDYLAQSTRYVSIQIGLGGLMPMSATEVYANKFGDCKALSNYMMAMLTECGINSYYTEIGIDDRNLIADYVNPTLTNHAILQVPLGADTLWLECTNPRSAPLGYIHEGIAGRNALVYKDGSAEVVRVGDYADSLHSSALVARMTMSDDYRIKAEVSQTNRLESFENIMFLGLANNEERMKYITKGLNGLAKFSVANISYLEDRGSMPFGTISYDLSYATPPSASRIFLNVFPFRRYDFVRLPRSRDSDIYIQRGYAMRDSVEITLPEGARIEVRVAPVQFSMPCGRYSASVKMLDDGRWIACRELIVRAGRYSSSMYADFQKFVGEVVNSNGARLVLIVK